jgi:flagellar basal-body rod protein FlgG
MGLSSVMQTALSGMAAAETSTALVANNLANSRTTGFKQSLPEFATRRGGGVLLAGTSVDTSQGTIAMGDQPLHFAVQGEGFFMVEGQQGETLYTRDGRFGHNAAGQLTTARGQRVVAQQDNGQYTFRLARFANPAGLQQRGDNLLAASPASGLPVVAAAGQSGTGQVLSGAEELSNTNVGRNVLDLALAATQFRANLLVLDTGEQLLEELTGLGRPS